MLSDDLGYSVETIRQGFPDAIVIDYTAGKRNRGVRKYVEFEYLSSSFARQKHDPKECDMIVCWEDNWKNRPKDLEVLELKSLVEKLKHQAKEQEVIEELVTPHAEGEKTPQDYHSSWDARMDWALPSTRLLAMKLISRLREFPGISSKSRFRWYCFYSKPEMRRKHEVAVLLLGKKTLRLAIRIRPNMFKDPENLTHQVAGFFFPGGDERRMSVTPENFESVVRLAKATYESLAGWFY